MIAVLQRVSKAQVAVGGTVTGSIGKGLVVLVCAERGDEDADLAYVARKVFQLRIFEDKQGRMNRSLQEVQGEALVVSQFTLAAAVRRGNRPSFEAAEEPVRACELYEAFQTRLREAGVPVRSGVFGAWMELSQMNAGPVTIIIDSREGKRR